MKWDRRKGDSGLRFCSSEILQSVWPHTHTELPCQIITHLSTFHIWHLQDRQTKSERDRCRVWGKLRSSLSCSSLLHHSDEGEIKAGVERSLRTTASFRRAVSSPQAVQPIRTSNSCAVYQHLAWGGQWQDHLMDGVSIDWESRLTDSSHNPDHWNPHHILTDNRWSSRGSWQYKPSLFLSSSLRRISLLLSNIYKHILFRPSQDFA